MGSSSPPCTRPARSRELLPQDKKDGDAEKPGKKGVSLTVDEWGALAPALPSLTQALQAQDDAQPPMQLSDTRRAYVSKYQ